MKSAKQRTIVFAMLSEIGHYTGTFRLARHLRARGHKVVYFGMVDFAHIITDQGFEFVPFATDLLPVGYIQQFHAARANSARGMLAKWRRRRADERFFAEFLRQIVNGRLDECLLSCKPDLVLCDTFLWYVALRALHLKIATINISCPLSLYSNPRIPPITSMIQPYQRWWDPVYVFASWKWLRLNFIFSKRLVSVLLGRYRFPTRMHHLVNVFKWIARQSGYVCKENKTYWFGEMGPRLVLPEIMLSPRAFQLPNKLADGRRYLGDFVDINRREIPLDKNIRNDCNLLVLCSLGTASASYPHSQRFFKAVIAAAGLCNDWQFILQVGDEFDAEKWGPIPSNLLIYQWMPQLTLLRKATVMVTHGGINSIMECIHFKVPMVIVPGLRDQPGNAVRAVWHNLALTTRMATITPQKMLDLIAKAMKDPGIREALARMKQKIAVEEGLNNTIAFVESVAAKEAVLALPLKTIKE